MPSRHTHPRPLDRLTAHDSPTDYRPYARAHVTVIIGNAVRYCQEPIVVGCSAMFGMDHSGILLGMTETTVIERDKKNGRFLAGNAGNGGRRPGARNKLGEQFLEDLRDSWVEQGPRALARCAEDDQPAIAASLRRCCRRTSTST